MFSLIKKFFKKRITHKIVNEEDIKLVEKYLRENENIISVVKPFQGKSPFSILEETGYIFEDVSHKEEALKKYDNIFTIYDYSSSETKIFLSVCAILHVLGKNIDSYVYSSEEDKKKYHKDYYEYIVNCFLPLEEIRSFIQEYMKERDCYVTYSTIIKHFDDIFYGVVMMRIYDSPLDKYIIYG